MPVRPKKFSIACIALIAAAAVVACSSREKTAQEANENGAIATPVDHEDVHRFALGELTAFVLRDGGFEFPNDNTILGVGRTPEEVSSLLAAAGAPEDKLSLSIQQLLIQAPDRMLLFDTGLGTSMGENGGRLIESFAAAKIDPARVTDIFVSHVHGDHVNGLINAEGALTFPNAVVRLSAPEWEFLQSLDATTAQQSGIAQYDALMAAVSPKVDAFTPDTEIIPGLVKAVDIKGHTPGHSGYLITSKDSSLLYIGDSMHHFVVSVQRPQWTIQFDRDSATASKSRSELLERSAESAQLIHAPHFPFPGLGKIERRAEGPEGFVWVAESSGWLHAAHQ